VLYNRIRRTLSPPASLVRRGRILELPLYYVLRTSDLAREGFENGGSFRFADHIYRNQASGSGRFGRWLDRRILDLAAVRSFRSRYLRARQAVFDLLRERVHGGNRVDVLSVPAGIPRELVEAACQFRELGGSLKDVRLHALDLDADVLEAAQKFAAVEGIALSVHLGDVFDREVYGGEFDFITSTGFGEFVNDRQLENFYTILCECLRPGGVFVTSAMRPRRTAEYLLRLAELEIHYREGEELAGIASRAGFTETETSQDELGIQSFLRARR
jgi:SAM-dependent methyltransferase